MKLDIETAVESRLRKIKNEKLRTKMRKIFRDRAFYMLAAFGLVWYFIFKYIPIYGIKYAFTNFGRSFVPQFIGFENFRRFFDTPDFMLAFKNTLAINLLQIAFGFPATIIVALLLNEIQNSKLKRTFQTVICLPHFLSWVIVASIWITILSPSRGLVNAIIEMFGGEAVFFWIKPEWFKPLMVVTNMWKGLGYGTIIYLAAMSRAEKELYDAAIVDGANRLEQCWHITIPAILPVIAIMFILSFDDILDGFEQIFVFMNGANRAAAETIDTYTYKMGIKNMDVGFATAVGLFKNVVGLVMVLTTNFVTKKRTNESLI
ncbi:MAG: sugar ABC transporter permease [Ruminiclostridium sp.]|nr:sugar ABC transporter permease [Ruminiclostridium sp.]